MCARRRQDLHLATFAVEVQREAATVGEPKSEGAVQSGMLLEALTQGVANTIAAGHERTHPQLLL